MTTRARKGGKAAAEAAATDDSERQLRDMNEALLVSSVRQHKETERALAALRQTETELRALNEALEQRLADAAQRHSLCRNCAGSRLLRANSRIIRPPHRAAIPDYQEHVQNV